MRSEPSSVVTVLRTHTHTHTHLPLLLIHALDTEALNSTGENTIPFKEAKGTLTSHLPVFKVVYFCNFNSET